MLSWSYEMEGTRQQWKPSMCRKDVYKEKYKKKKCLIRSETGKFQTSPLLTLLFIQSVQHIFLPLLWDTFSEFCSSYLIPGSDKSSPLYFFFQQMINWSLISPQKVTFKMWSRRSKRSQFALPMSQPVGPVPMGPAKQLADSGEHRLSY